MHGEIKNPSRADPLQPMQFAVQSEKDTPSHYELRGWAFPSFSPASELDILLLIKSGTRSYYFPDRSIHQQYNDDE